MKTISLLFTAFISINCFAQLEDRFVREEARDLIAICNSFTFIDLYNSDAGILPHGYEKTYTSGTFGMDNRYQIYQKGDIAVINLRGSTEKKISWLENIHSAMIPAKGTIKISGEEFNYCFAQDPQAAVHSGYALGIAYLYKDIIFHINVLNNQGIYNIIITGHSQGGSLANVLRAYLENLSNYEISKSNKFKTYSFAAPMVGNKAFADEYNRRFCINNSSFNIVNPADPFPTLPLSYNDSNYANDKLSSSNDSFKFKKMVSDGLVLLFEESLNKTMKKLSYSASTQISRDLGPVEMPAFIDGIAYQHIGNRIEISQVVYPKILKDSSILQNDSLMAIYKIGPDGNFPNKELYKKEPWAYQHKPYNYYVSILKTYFPNQYMLLKKKYLSENL